MLSCGPTRRRYGGFTSFTELVQSGFSVAFFFDDIGVERRWLEEGVLEEGVGRVRVRGWIYVLTTYILHLSHQIRSDLPT
jgi:hypothetical protein